MPLRNTDYRALAWLLLLTISATAAPLAPAQEVRIPSAALESAGNVDAILANGESLEQDGRWGDAIVHYEKALKEHAGNRQLESRLQTARRHLDVTRRYADPSYLDTLQSLSEQSALNVYDEVLRKINANYVSAPDWNELVRLGAAHFEVALAEKDYVNKNLPGVPPEKISAFRNELNSVMDRYGARTIDDAKNLAHYVAKLSQYRLGGAQPPVLMEFTCGAVGSLDNYSAFLTTAQVEDIFSQIKGNFVGLGIELKTEKDSLVIVDVITGGPAEQGGIKPGDRIIEVDGASMQDISTDAAAERLKGEEGTEVEVMVVSPDQEPRPLRLIRRRVELPSVEDAKIIDANHGIAYLRLPSFQETTSRDLDATLWDLHRQGMRSLVIDLRGNPGGLLNSSVQVADKFVSAGTIVSTRGRVAREDFDYKAHYAGTWRVPLVVLIDGDSASASEIFAGAIHDHRRGWVVGETSYGKGSVQGIFKLNSSTMGVRLTTAKFFSPSGRAISDRGVKPDIPVQVTAKPTVGRIAEADDAILQAGIKAAQRQLTQLSQR